jgi:hypothetical protein
MVMMMDGDVDHNEGGGYCSSARLATLPLASAERHLLARVHSAPDPGLVIVLTVFFASDYGFDFFACPCSCGALILVSLWCGAWQ